MSASVLPARAGMSPVAILTVSHPYGAPRTGGDEPGGCRDDQVAH